ncbi:hypothetical protein CDAR_400521 [Caerostris darwini]|uniref:Secreted protein n=1 Tax=Caerostris darwini TaxID=1538125 RepID=A0AAV4P932_9ARAC|nr:hypothetical protein CDAR_400521 [Caerostris darwini]
MPGWKTDDTHMPKNHVREIVVLLLWPLVGFRCACCNIRWDKAGPRRESKLVVSAMVALAICQLSKILPAATCTVKGHVCLCEASGGRLLVDTITYIYLT